MKSEPVEPKSEIYLCLVTWPDGTEGLLFPKPGNRPVAQEEASGRIEFLTAKTHLLQYIETVQEHGGGWKLNGLKVRLVKFQRLEVVHEYVHGA